MAIGSTAACRFAGPLAAWAESDRGSSAMSAPMECIAAGELLSSTPLAVSSPADIAIGSAIHVQRIGPMDQAHHHLARLHRKLSADYDGPEMPPPPKPKWMRLKTYSRIVQQIEAGQERLDVAFTVGAQHILAQAGKIGPTTKATTMNTMPAPAEMYSLATTG